ncbi:hypothetical protein [Bradyrhizobium cytisi]|uniref:Uncharacterized protein n=1 Tax=Bradyrhizobium cytisi TaxID=515489 RepID=A0A5S4X1P7_9BRAD|nr:hypothetical protein [Bradyrhizobium cytisi]TYL86351.1 hypothetical protein FXB38_07690 [Bradyrhizobium cytisi]
MQRSRAVFITGLVYALIGLAGAQSTPMSYEVDGKQYVVTAAGGHGSFGTKRGDYVIAYALKD